MAAGAQSDDELGRSAPATSIRPDKIGISKGVAEEDEEGEHPTSFLKEQARADVPSKRSSSAEVLHAERSSDISIPIKSSDSNVDVLTEGPEDFMAHIKSYDPMLDIGGKEETHILRCALLEKIGAWLDAFPFPPSIRPLPCLRRKGYCNRFCEANRFCYYLAKQGIGCMGHLRKLILVISTFFTCISIMLRGMPAAAMGTDRASLEGYPWAYGNYACLKPETCAGLDARVMIGLTSLLVISDNLNMKNSIEWGSDDCENQLTSLGAGDYCSICRDASQGCAAVALLSIATGLVNLFTDIQRMRARNDHNFAKNLAVVSNVIGALQQLFAVSIFHGLCVAEFPLEDAASTFRLELEMGSGGALLASAVALNIFGITIHLIIPVPEARWRVYGVLGERDPAPGEWPSLQKEATVTTFAGALPDPDAPALTSSDTVRGDGPGWDDGKRMMSRSVGAPSGASDRVADLLNIDSASRNSVGSNGSKHSVLSKSAEGVPKNLRPSSVEDLPANIPNAAPPMFNDSFYSQKSSRQS